MATLFSDNFNRADNPSLGADWTEKGANFDIVTNRVEAITSPGTATQLCHTATYGVPDYTVQLIVQPPIPGAPLDAYCGAVGRRVNNGANESDGYFVFVNDFSNEFTVYKELAAVYTLLGTFATTITAQDYTVKLSMQGTTIKGFLAGTERVSVTDTSLSANGDGGLTTATGVNATAARFDDVLVENFAGATATGRPPFGFCLLGVQ